MRLMSALRRVCFGTPGAADSTEADARGVVAAGAGSEMGASCGGDVSRGAAVMESRSADAGRAGAGRSEGAVAGGISRLEVLESWTRRMRGMAGGRGWCTTGPASGGAVLAEATGSASELFGSAADVDWRDGASG
ncbi:MAG TPA: hypothetical protein VGS10_02460 [Terracidiphilus sp.]|nr:hypothetical protein [Terracidiphilus sp.]